MSVTTVFLWAAAGSLAVEVVTIGKHYDSGGLELPARYYRIGFWVARVLVAIVGGGLAVAYGVTQPLLAGHICAATPLIMKTLAESVPAGLYAGKDSVKAATHADAAIRRPSADS